MSISTTSGVRRAALAIASNARRVSSGSVSARIPRVGGTGEHYAITGGTGAYQGAAGTMTHPERQPRHPHLLAQLLTRTEWPRKSRTVSANSSGARCRQPWRWPPGRVGRASGKTGRHRLRVGANRGALSAPASMSVGAPVMSA